MRRGRNRPGKQQQAFVEWAEQWLRHFETLKPDVHEPTYREIVEEMNRHRSADNQIPLPEDNC